MASKSALSRLSSPLAPAANGEVTRKLDLDTRGGQAGGYGPPRHLRQPLPFSGNANHSAFPSLVRRDDGVIVMVYRKGSDHSATRDGNVWKSTSSDLGRTWTTAAAALSAPVAGNDRRDPCISKSNDGSTLYLSYFVGTASLSAAGVYFRKSTDGGVNWTSEVRVEALPYAASSAPVVQLASGRLILPLYGRSGAETLDSVWIAYSDDGGTNWTNTRILNGTTLGQHLQEPWVSRKPGADNLFMSYRYTNGSNIGASWTTSNTGITGWSAATSQFAGTGRPANVWLSDNTVLVQYRDIANSRFMARMCDAPETASTWGKPYVARNTMGGGMWTYCHSVELGGQVSLCVFSEENSGATASKIYTTTVARGGGGTPLGVIPDNYSAISSLYDRVAYAIDLNGERGTASALPPDLNVLSGGISQIETSGGQGGVLSSTTADGTPDRAYVETGVADVAIEGDFYGTTESGYALLCRVVDASNFLMFTVETTFANIRLYKVVAGVATQLATLAQPTPASSWHTLRVEARGTLITCVRDSYPVLIYNLAAGAEANTFTTPTKHGFGLNAQSTGVHYLRRFVVWTFGH